MVRHVHIVLVCPKNSSYTKTSDGNILPIGEIFLIKQSFRISSEQPETQQRKHWRKILTSSSVPRHTADILRRSNAQSFDSCHGTSAAAKIHVRRNFTKKPITQIEYDIEKAQPKESLIAIKNNLGDNWWCIETPVFRSDRCIVEVQCLRRNGECNRFSTGGFRELLKIFLKL